MTEPTPNTVKRIDKRTSEQRAAEDRVRRLAKRNGKIAKKTGDYFALLDAATKEVIDGLLTGEQIVERLTTTT